MLNRMNMNEQTWVNLREEPIIFINGKPYSLRNVNDMINNLIFTGIDSYDGFISYYYYSERVLEIENKFKQDIIHESSINHSMIMVNDEDEDNHNTMHLLPVTDTSIVTVISFYLNITLQLEDVYRKVNKNFNSIQISLFRIPITDEQAPLATTIDDLLNITFSNFQDYFVFNCQIGRGRTTTGMIICSMALAFKKGEWHSLINRMTNDSTSEYGLVQIPDNKQKELLQGFYPCVIELIGMMKSGSKAKRKLDYIIDLSSDMQNIREVIYHYHVSYLRIRVSNQSISLSAQSTKKQEESLDRAIHFLHRYCVLLILAEYFEEHLPDEVNPRFSEWLTSHEEYTDILKSISLQ